jgi:protoporphyrinogen oxidase
MRIAILGGGFTGLTAAHYLAKDHHHVEIFEKSTFLGGLAAGFQEPEWDWPLEYAYHHIFSSDAAFIDLANDTQFGEVSFYSPTTSSLYRDANGDKESFAMYPLDTPFDLLRFPLLSIPERLRAGVVLALLKFGPNLPLYEREPVERFLTNSMGHHAWDTLFGEIFRKKFGTYAGNILTSFMWARIKARTKQLGYPHGGFQQFIDHIAQSFEATDTHIHTQARVQMVEKNGPVFQLYYNSSVKKEFDVVISTLPTPVLVQVAGELFPDTYIQQLRQIRYLYAATLILETEKPLLDDIYWLNSATDAMPFMVLVQHTNMIDPQHYGGKHLAYIGNYYDEKSILHTMDKQAALAYFTPHLQRLVQRNELGIERSYWFQAPYAQPVYDTRFLSSKPDMLSPVRNFYIANLDMTYPYDRGTNYAIKLGKDVAKEIELRF